MGIWVINVHTHRMDSHIIEKASMNHKRMWIKPKKKERSKRHIFLLEILIQCDIYPPILEVNLPLILLPSFPSSTSTSAPLAFSFFKLPPLRQTKCLPCHCFQDNFLNHNFDYIPILTAIISSTHPLNLSVFDYCLRLTWLHSTLVLAISNCFAYSLKHLLT